MTTPDVLADNLALQSVVKYGYAVHFWPDGHWSVQDSYGGHATISDDAQVPQIVAGRGGETLVAFAHALSLSPARGLQTHDDGRRLASSSDEDGVSSGERGGTVESHGGTRYDGSGIVCDVGRNSSDAVAGGGGVDRVASRGTDSVKGEVVSEKTLRNREKRLKKKRAKERKRSGIGRAFSDLGGHSGVASEVGTAKVSVVGGSSEFRDESSVPEWRVKSEDRRRQLAEVRRDLSQFAVCSDDVRQQLAESRAKALIARNKADVLKAEEQARITAARMKAGVPERRVEKQRIELNTKLVPLVKQQQVHEMGFVEAGSVSGSLGSMPSLSPDDSISVSDRIKMEEANNELRRRLEAVEVQCGELRLENRALRNNGGTTLPVERFGKFGTISFKEECEALESILDSKRDPMEDASHACDEDCIEECWKYDRDLNLRPEYREY